MNSFAIKNAAKLAFYKKSTGLLAAYFPFGNSLTISVTGDKVEALAQGTTAVVFQANRKATAKLDTQIINDKIMAIVLGATSSTLGTGTMAQFQSGKFGTVTANLTLESTPSTSSLSVFLTDTDGVTVISELTAIGSAPTAAQYTITGTTITTNVANLGKNVLCIYTKDGTNIEQTVIKANEFAQAYRVVGIGLVKDVNGVEHLQEINIPNATAQSSADYTYSASDAANFSFTFDLAADPVTQELFSFKSL